MKLPTEKLEAYITQEGDLNIRVFMTKKNLKKWGPKLAKKNVYADFLEEIK